ncbi:MAG: hypothetical protein WCX10_04010 [Bacteroidales bacterium]|jgi:hypothetical protein|nr:hypothetical protein [Bacteroidales bacterium]MEA4967541.1 hypothetical protein [Bacteroidaceae bacterium]MEA5099412.1 hypothetical protein [Bacteroidales bacterium]
MEDLLIKDKIKEANPYLFQKIQMRIAKKDLLPKWAYKSINVGFAFLILFMTLNILSFTKTDYVSKEISQKTYDKFMEDNYFDILVNYYPSELLNIEKSK